MAKGDSQLTQFYTLVFLYRNSGIANLAFFLLSQGGSHPRGKTNVQVTGVGMETAAKIFYYANNACLTASSQFADARRCTMQYGRNYGVEQNVNDAWAAVGVGEGDTPPPEPPTSTIQIYDNNAVNNVAVATDGVQNYLMYNVAAGEKVQCTTSGDNGDADLYVRFGSPADPDPYSWLNECASYGSDSNEACTTSAASEHTVAYAAVHAWAGFSGLTVKCVILPNPVKQIYHNVWVQGLSLPDTRFLRFYMQGIQSGDKVRCVLQGNNGDADLYVRFWQQAVMDPDSTLNNCKSTSDNSYEACTTNRVNANTNAYVAVKAWSAFDNLSLKCWRIACKKLYWGCTAHHQCCPGTFCRWKPDGSGRTCRP